MSTHQRFEKGQPLHVAPHHSDGRIGQKLPADAGLDSYLLRGRTPEGQLETLLQPENKAQLQAILKYHVVSGAAMAADVTGLDAAPTLEGRPVQFQVDDGAVTLMGENTATVVQADIEASNGVIHVIDSVLLPPEQQENEATSDEGYGR